MKDSKKIADVSVIIPAYNEESYVSRCLTSVLEQDYTRGKIEILFVDGGSSDNTIEVVSEIESKVNGSSNCTITILNNPQKIAASGMNTGFKAAKGDVLIPFSAHAYMKSDFISQSIACLEETEADIAGGIVISAPDSSTYLSRAIGKALNTKFALGGITARTGKKRRPMENPSFGAYRREIFDKYGYMDENLKRNTDYEFNLRLHNAGLKIMFCPDIKSYYFNRPTLKSLYRQYYDTSFNKAAMIGRYRNIIRMRHIVPSAFFLALIIAIAVSFFSPIAMYSAFSLAGLYLLGAIIFSVPNIKYLPVLPIIYLTIHFGYGLGFIWGFLNRRRG